MLELFDGIVDLMRKRYKRMGRIMMVLILLKIMEFLVQVFLGIYIMKDMKDFLNVISIYVVEQFVCEMFEIFWVFFRYLFLGRVLVISLIKFLGSNDGMIILVEVRLLFYFVYLLKRYCEFVIEND